MKSGKIRRIVGGVGLGLALALSGVYLANRNYGSREEVIPFSERPSKLESIAAGGEGAEKFVAYSPQTNPGGIVVQYGDKSREVYQSTKYSGGQIQNKVRKTWATRFEGKDVICAELLPERDLVGNSSGSYKIILIELDKEREGKARTLFESSEDYRPGRFSFLGISNEMKVPSDITKPSALVYEIGRTEKDGKVHLLPLDNKEVTSPSNTQTRSISGITYSGKIGEDLIINGKSYSLLPPDMDSFVDGKFEVVSGKKGYPGYYIHRK